MKTGNIENTKTNQRFGPSINAKNHRAEVNRIFTIYIYIYIDWLRKNDTKEKFHYVLSFLFILYIYILFSISFKLKSPLSESFFVKNVFF